MNSRSDYYSELVEEKMPKYQKIFIWSVFVLALAFVLPMGSSATCNGSNNIINSTTISDGCTLNTAGTYIFAKGNYNLNGSSSGAISFATNNIRLEGNNSFIYGNYSSTLSAFPVGLLYSSRTNITINNLTLNNYWVGHRILNSNNISIYNSTIYNTSSSYNIRNSNNTIIINNFMGEVINSAINLDNTLNYNLTIKDNIFRNIGFFAISSAVNNLNLLFYNNTITNGSLLSSNYLTNSIIDSNYLSNKSTPTSIQISLIHNMTNSIIKDNIFENINSALYIYEGNILNISNNNFKDCLGYMCIEVFKSSNSRINILNNLMDNIDIGVSIIHSKLNNSINILNNTITNPITNYQLASENIRIINSSNILVNQNNILNVTCVGVILNGNSSEVNITNNLFQQIRNDQRNESMHCDSELTVGIGIQEIWRGWVFDSTELATNNYSNKLQYYQSGNVYINNNSFLNFNIPLRIDDGYNIIHDISLLDNWYLKYRFPQYLIGTTQLWINNSYNNVTVWERNGLNTLTAYQWWHANSTQKFNYTLTKDYLNFKNTRTFTIQTEIYNQTNSLIYFSNGSVACSNIATCDGNINITLTPNNYSYVLDNFNLTEGVTRQFSPLSISGTSTSKTITSQLSQGITATVVVNAPSCPISGTYDGTSISSSSCNGNQATFLLEDIPAGVSVLSLSQVTTITDSLIDQLALTPALIGLILLALFFGIAIKALLDFRNMGKIDWKQLLIQVIIVGFIGIVLLLFSVVYQTLGNIGG